MKLYNVLTSGIVFLNRYLMYTFTPQVWLSGNIGKSLVKISFKHKKRLKTGFLRRFERFYYARKVLPWHTNSIFFIGLTSFSFCNIVAHPPLKTQQPDGLHRRAVDFLHMICTVIHRSAIINFDSFSVLHRILHSQH